MPGPFTLLHQAVLGPRFYTFTVSSGPKFYTALIFRWRAARALGTTPRIAHFTHRPSPLKGHRSAKVSCEAASSTPRTGGPPMTASSSESTSTACSRAAASPIARRLRLRAHRLAPTLHVVVLRRGGRAGQSFYTFTLLGIFFTRVHFYTFTGKRPIFYATPTL